MNQPFLKCYHTTNRNNKITFPLAGGSTYQAAKQRRMRPKRCNDGDQDARAGAATGSGLLAVDNGGTLGDGTAA
jgi:hypothetical protein